MEIAFDFNAEENIGGIDECSQIILVADEDIISQTPLQVTCAKIYKIYFTEETADYKESQTMSPQGALFTQEIDFAHPKISQIIINFVTQNHRKYFWVWLKDKNNYTREVGLLQLLTQSGTGRQAGDRNQVIFKLEGQTILPARTARNLIQI